MAFPPSRPIELYRMLRDGRAGADKVQRLKKLVAEAPVFPFSKRAASAAVDLESTLAAQPIGQFDLLIAAHALSMGAVCVTDNENEFRRVTGLKIENWRRP
ncbi:MAG: type II toxin-antitoxin system VapC family toxin [Betaproteobacteria bacterium]|nr:type II toxin-antitoxin system VapC family toxin [Betaproteobacteria bacterium]